jgi:hypothetical protein
MMTLLLALILAAIVVCCPLLRRAVFATVQVVGAAFLVVALLVALASNNAHGQVLRDTDEVIAFGTAIELMFLDCDGNMSSAAKTFTARRYNDPRYRAKIDTHLAALLEGRNKTERGKFCAAIVEAYGKFREELRRLGYPGA